MKPKAAAIKNALQELRAIVESETVSPFDRRIAQAMETAIRWATESTEDWPEPADEAKAFAQLLKAEAASVIKFK